MYNGKLGQYTKKQYESVLCECHQDKKKANKVFYYSVTYEIDPFILIRIVHSINNTNDN
jgi:hypothetical protein